MADVWATKNGVWSDVTVWNTGALPTTADDVYADGRIVYIDINTRVLSISNGTRSGGTVNGYFIGNDNISLSANVLCRDGSGGSVTACLELLSATPSLFTVYGNVVGAAAPNGRAIRGTSSGTLTVYGDVSGGTGSGTAWGIDNQSTGIINVIGNIRAFNVVNAGAINNNSTGTVNVTGNVFGSSTAGASNCRGITNIDGIVNVLGNVTATTGSNNHGILNSTGSSNPRVNVIGVIFGGTNGAVNNSGTGTVSITGNVFGTNGLGVANTGGSAGTINIRGNVTGILGIGCQNTGSGTVNVVGNIEGGIASAVVGISNFSTGTVNVTGNSTAGITTNTHGTANNSIGVVNLFGDAYGGSSGTIGGVANTGAGTCNIIGNAYSGTPGSSSHGIINTNSSTGVINLTGNAYANFATAIQNGSGPSSININGSVFGGSVTNAHGVQNASSTGTVVVAGSAVGGTVSTAYGAFNGSTGILRVKRAVGNNWGLGFTTVLAGTPGVFSSLSGSQTFVEELECGPRGQWPTGGVIFFTPNPKATSQFETDTFQNYTLIKSNSADNLLPPVSSVRQGEVYDLGTDTGTCIIPPASSVGFGVPVDNTTGTATLVSTNVWNISSQEITDNQSIGGRLRNTLTANAAERLVNSFNLN